MLTQGLGTPRRIGGSTANSLTQGFITVQTAGVRELAQRLEKLAAEVGKPSDMWKIVRKAAGLIERGYKSRVSDVTGNLRGSVKIEPRYYERATVAVVGPAQTGNRGSSKTQLSGNHAWLVEWGSGRRRPGTKGRRTYVNVHQMINRRMSRHSSANDMQFKNMAGGYYFLMGSKNEPTRQARDGSGYPHDFGTTNGKSHPITLRPGQTYGAMPAKHPMERTIKAEQQAVFNTLKSALENSINRLTQS